MPQDLQTPNFIFSDGSVIPRIAFGTGAAVIGVNASSFGVQALASGFLHLDVAELVKPQLYFLEQLLTPL